MEDSDTLANVVVSDSQNLPDEEEEETKDGDLEDTTERAILKDETAVDEKGEEEPESLKDAEYGEPDDSDKESVREPLYERSSEDQSFDEEATQLSDLNLKNPLPLGKPQMAESRKVKNKRRKFGLLGIFKKSNK